MVTVEVVGRDIKGILIDGYMPDTGRMQKKNWMKVLDEKLPSSVEYRGHFKRNIYGQFLKPGKSPLNDGPRSNIYRSLTSSFRREFCSYNEAPCIQYQAPAKGVKPIERIIAFERKKVRDIALPAINREIEKSMSDGKGDYIFHFSYLDLNQDNYCPVFEQCCNNWIENMGFEIKKEGDYADFQAYKGAAEELLKSGIEFQISVNRFSEEDILRQRNRVLPPYSLK